MCRQSEPRPGEIYKHFKDKLYQIITVASHTETNEKMVVYQALYGDFKTYARPLTMFMSKVDKEKYPLVQEIYRFEKIALSNQELDQSTETVNLNTSNGLNKEIELDKENGLNKAIELDKANELNQPINQFDFDESKVNPILMEFLDARTYKEKLSIVMGNKNKITDKLINAMAASLDCTVEEGNIDDRLNGFLFCLQTFSRFENNRIR